MPTEAVLQLVHDVMASPWIYLALYLIAVVDAFFPVVPSESAVIAAGAFAASGEPALPLVMVVAALGACTGDHISYLFGRTVGGRLMRRLPEGSRRRDAYDRARRALDGRGGLVLVVARYVPGGRTAVTLTMGSVGYPARRFAGFDALAATSWAAYSGMVGYLGGLAFEREPWKGVLLGIGLALAVTVLVEVVRLLRHRKSSPTPVRRVSEDVRVVHGLPAEQHPDMGTTRHEAGVGSVASGELEGEPGIQDRCRIRPAHDR